MSATTLTLGELRAERSERIAEWFKDHVATYRDGFVGGMRVERLVWRQPATRNRFMVYTCLHGGILLVTGDMEDAVYATGFESLRRWSEVELDYFAGKCTASTNGRGYKSWDERVAQASVRDFLDMYAGDDPKMTELFDEREGRDELASREQWSAWLAENGHEVFGDDYWELGSMGESIDDRCEAHLVGLKMAFTSLEQP